MDWKNTATRYGSLSIGLHWLMLLLFVGVYASIELRELYAKGSDPREALKSLHFALGMLVFALVWLRIAARLSGPSPAIHPAPAQSQQLAAKLLHLALYVLMVGMPLSGWLLLSAAGKAIPFDLPTLIEANKEVASQIKEVHEFIGTTGYFLIGGHVIAALYHQLVVRDDTLTRILPFRK